MGFDLLLQKAAQRTAEYLVLLPKELNAHGFPLPLGIKGVAPIIYEMEKDGNIWIAGERKCGRVA
jgi:hypothetical protein